MTDQIESLTPVEAPGTTPTPLGANARPADR